MYVQATPNLQKTVLANTVKGAVVFDIYSYFKNVNTFMLITVLLCTGCKYLMSSALGFGFC